MDLRLLFLSCLVSHVCSYNLVIKNSLPRNQRVFDLSNIKQIYGKEWNHRLTVNEQVSKIDNVPFYFDKSDSTLRYSPVHQSHSQYKTYIFQVCSQSNDGGHEIITPFQIAVLPTKVWEFFLNTNFSSLPFNEFPDASAMLNGDRLLIRYQLLLQGHFCPHLFLSSSLCRCDVEENFLPSVPPLMVVEQKIGGCVKDDIAIPRQTARISLHHQVTHFLPSEKVMLRRRRSSRRRLYFPLQHYPADINENESANTRVIDMEVSDNNGVVRTNDVRYSLEALENKQSLNLFTINPATGVVRTTQRLDREVMSVHKFLVRAVRGNTQASCKLFITVNDVNDNKPRFEQSSYRTTLDENIPAGSQVLRITASDIDSGENSKLDFRIIPSVSVFTITDDGVLQVAGVVDREHNSSFSLQVKACDRGTPSLCNSVPVTITVRDLNDNRPQFSKSLYSVRIPEDTPVNRTITTVHAVDRDSDLNGLVNYAIIHGSRKFEINSRSGEIKLVSRLDYEEASYEPDGVYTLQIKASDNGSPHLSNNSGQVKVKVVDVNDHAPQFLSPSFHLSIREDVAIPYEVDSDPIEAYDIDEGENGRITYSILSSGQRLPFRINPSTGVVKVVQRLDYEQTKVYRFRVRASDNGPIRKSASVQVTTNVVDVNDNAPQFNQSSYFAKISETARPRSYVVNVQAIDPDEQASSGGYGIRYRIVAGDPTKKFRMLSRGGIGEISLLKKLDYNEKSSYRLTVTATDGVNTNATVVDITVIDTNSHRPVFDQAIYSKTLSESTSVGGKVLTVHATDRDVGENARITYCFYTENVIDFEIDRESGEITTRRTLDYEKSKVLELVVRAQDNGIPQKYDDATVNIYLRDANDNAPKFGQSIYKGSVSEDAKVQTKVVQIHATDVDSDKNGRVLYTLADGDIGNDYFSIDKKSGIIRTAQVLDREYIPEYHLVAYATDEGETALSSSVIVHIEVTDIDDNPPRFPADVMTRSVSEDHKISTPVTQISATDPDEGNSPIRYDLGHDPVVLNQWRLDSHTGELWALYELDYEKKTNYTISVSATSNELVSQATLVILVEDCNDNAPVINDFEIIFNNYGMPHMKSFPTGVIGKVPAYDPDVSDRLTYTFVAGNEGNLLKMDPVTGDLQLSSSLGHSNRQFTTKITIRVTDGKFHAEGVCTLKVADISDEMLQHSITVRVLNMNAYTFLSPVMYQFIDGLAEILNTTSQDIFVFNVQNDTDVEKVVLNVSFSAKKDHQFIPSKALQDQIYLNRLKLVNRTTKNVLPFDDNICLREPCQNYKRCTSVLTFNSTAPFVSSLTMIFRPIYPVYKLKCECPIGFTNDETCADEVDLCYSSPCVHGRCMSQEGGYTCACDNGYAGRNCEIGLWKVKCSDHPNICKNGGICVDDIGKLSCICPKSFKKTDTTDLCGLRSRHFELGDFLVLQGITKQWHFKLSISFATVESDGLIFYNGRLNHEHDFMALELVDGQVQLNFSTGDSWTAVNPVVSDRLNDGHWHTVHIQYFNKLSSGPLPQGVSNRGGPSATKVVVVTVDPDKCDFVVASQWNTTLGSYSCSKLVEQEGTKNSLDLTSPLLLGGVPNLPEAYQVHSKAFRGCLRDLIVDEELVDFEDSIDNHGSGVGCPQMDTQCPAGWCYNQAKCDFNWNKYKCKCEDGFTGSRCQHVSSFVIKMSGGGCWYYAVGRFKNFVLPWQQSISFRTVDDDAILMYVGLGTSSSMSLILKILQGHLYYVVSMRSSTEQVSLLRTRVDDGSWHEAKVTWVASGNKVIVTLSLDYDSEEASVIFSAPYRKDVNKLYIGGNHIGGTVVQHPYDGCFQNIKIGPSNNPHQVDVKALSVRGKVDWVKNCNGQNFCKSNPCPSHSTCTDKWDRYECSCKPGYVGEDCVSVCSLNLCENGATCMLNASAEHGYQCNCSSGFYGQHCQFQHTETCPDGWFGKSICAPCNCSSRDNFDPVCDNLTGKCRCKTFHYFHPSTGTCKSCDCYHLGSKSFTCSSPSGQCSCKRGVSGKQCTSCASDFAEVRENGCLVVYDRCPDAKYQSILWKGVPYGAHRPVKCPDSIGTATRACVKDQGWLEPNYSNCTAKEFYPFAVEMKNFNENTSLTTEMSMQLAYDLKEATRNAESYFEKDALNSYLLIRHLLDAESNKTGFDLTTAQDSNFTDNLAQATSSLLENSTEQYWEEGMTSPRGLSAPRLVQSWERYTENLLKNLHLMLYEHIVVNTPNMDVNLEKVDTKIHGGEGFSYSSRSKGSSPTQVDLPAYLFAPSRSKRSKSNATVRSSQVRDDSVNVGVVTYNKINRVFPKSFAYDRTFRVPEKPSVNSDVISVQVHRNTSHSPSSNVKELDQPVVLTFRLLDEDAIEPQCLSWDFTAGSTKGEGGGWTQQGCTSQSNKTHVICRCYHLSTFAVITDEGTPSITARMSVRIAMVIGVTISSIFLLASISISAYLSGVTSVQAAVNKNLDIALLLSNILYVAGIQQTSNIYSCMAIAVCLHFLLLGSFAWLFVSGFHLYRVLTERRDINHGNAKTYYILGWIVPAIITALSVGLDAKGYGNPSFCWISFNDALIWSFAAPVIICCVVYLVLFVMSVQVYLSSKRVDMKRSELLYQMRTSFIVAPVVMGTWAFAVYGVNLDYASFLYMFSVAVALLGVLAFLFHSYFSREVREAYRKYQWRAAQRPAHNTTMQQLLHQSVGRTPESSLREGVIRRYDNSTSESLSLNHSRSVRKSPLGRSGGYDSDASDSYDDTSSDSSMSLDSSSEDEQVQINTYHNICNTKPDYIPNRTDHLPYFETRGNGKLPGNGHSRADTVELSKRNCVEDSLSDGSNETSM
ncbi:unnamed protein product [Clavelina lepadiformis]|uniref:Uncharacterized protein n=1 Tax=Clavelina lepadiformis TaxID=159417 RepID=A0ABP0G2L4_CLALP